MDGLEAMKADTKEKISSDAKGEESAVENFGDLETSKKTEISTLLEQLERKMKRRGELKVEIVDLQRSLAGAGDSLAEVVVSVFLVTLSKVVDGCQHISYHFIMS